MGTPGTSGDIEWDQAETLLLDHEFVLMPMPNLERFLKMCNMKEWQCGVLQICDYRGEPFLNPLPYALFFNDLTIVTDWICTGETNKDGIFHTHAMFRTGVRSDSLRRSMHTTWNKLMGYSNFREMLGGRSATMDCLKLQKCHKPESMMCYLMKNPAWVIATKYDYLDACNSIDGWQLNERFKPKEDDGPVITEAGEMNKMTQELIELITEFGCKTFEDCLRFGPIIMQKYLHRPGLNTIVNNCLQFVKTTGSAWNLSVYEKHRPRPDYIHRVLLFQGVPPSDFDKIFFAWITKSDSKKNTIVIQGPSNTGKSAFIAGFKQCVTWGEIVNAPTFAFEGLCDTSIGVWEEPLISPELAEKTKQVFEGMPTSIPIKHKRPQMLPRTPILVTTNHNLWRFCTQEEEMFKNRAWIFYFNYCPKEAIMFPRTRESSCKCCNCRTSGSGSVTYGPTSPGYMPRGEQPVVGTVRTELTSEMGSGSMHGTDAGVSSSTPASRTSSSTDLECASTSKSSGTAGDTAQQHMGAFRIIRGDPAKCRVSSDRGSMESYVSRRRTRDDSSSARCRSDGGGNVGLSVGGDGNTQEKHDSSGNVELQSQNVQKKAKTKRYPEGPELDKYLESVNEPMISLMFTPSKQDWQNYLSYLYHRYG